MMKKIPLWNIFFFTENQKTCLSVLFHKIQQEYEMHIQYDILNTLIMDFTNIYFKDNYLVIEDSVMLGKIDINSFDDIIISHEFPRRTYKLNMFFTKPVQYEPKKGFINKIICIIFKHNNNPNEIKRSYYDVNAERLLLMIEQCLPDADIPDLKNSVYWKTTDKKMFFDNVKLIYSKEGLGLSDVLRKHNMLIGK